MSKLTKDTRKMKETEKTKETEEKKEAKETEETKDRVMSADTTDAAVRLPDQQQAKKVVKYLRKLPATNFFFLFFLSGNVDYSTLKMLLLHLSSGKAAESNQTENQTQNSKIS